MERFVEQMPRERYRFTVLLPADGPYADRLRALGAEVVIVMMADDPPWVSIQTAVALVQHRGIDLIHAHLPRAHVLAGLVGRLTGRPVVATVHGRQPSVLDMEVHRTTGTHLSVVCQASYLSALGLGVSPTQLSCEPNGVDTRRFHPRPRGGLRASLGLAADAAQRLRRPPEGRLGRSPRAFCRSASAASPAASQRRNCGGVSSVMRPM